MELNRLQSHFRQECQRFSSLCEAILDHAVPSCPGWTVQDLVEHLGTVHRRALARIGSDHDPAGYDLGMPTEAHDMLDWFNAGWKDLASVLEASDPVAQAWNWTGRDQTVAWMIRRQAHEAAIHRYDAELAHMGLPSVMALRSLPAESIPSGYSADFAVDGIDERLRVSIGGRAGLKSSLPGSLHLHATDVAAEWSITLVDGLLNIENKHTKADAALQGTASELYLWSWGRIPTDMLIFFGSSQVVEGWKKLPA